jgi:outer membrane receptor protein involved in Fe transport
VDTQINWIFGAGPGQVGVNWLISRLGEFETSDYQGLPSYSRVGRTGGSIGSSLPEWKWNLNLSYGWDDLTLAAQWRYIDGMRDVQFDYEVPGYDYFDLFASYAFESGPLAGLKLSSGGSSIPFAMTARRGGAIPEPDTSSRRVRDTTATRSNVFMTVLSSHR